MRIIPEQHLSQFLHGVENPGRYVGGEYGSVVKESPLFKAAVCYPDLYEIGMSNQAVAILYGIINSYDDASCERVFCPAPDFERALDLAGIPLFGLDCGTPLPDFDLIAFTIGYELSAKKYDEK